MQTFKVHVTVINDRNASAAAALISDPVDGTCIAEATGSAKREPGDVHDTTIAATLATGRALEKLGQKLLRSARVQVREAEARRVLEDERGGHRRLRRLAWHKEREDKRLPIGAIRGLYGPEAAKRAEARRAR